MGELKTVRLLGAAGRKFGRVFRLAVASPAEAIRAIEALRPGFYEWVVQQHERGVAWRVIAGEQRGLEADELDRGTSAETIVFAPVLAGAGGGDGGGGFWSIILGILLIAVAIFVPAAALGLTSMLGVGLVGGALVLGGVAQLLTPTPTLNDTGGVEASQTAALESNLFSRNQGTGGQGECVPLVYGQRRVSSPRVISFDLRNLPETRTVTTTGTQGLLGYVNQQNLS